MIPPARSVRSSSLRLSGLGAASAPIAAHHVSPPDVTAQVLSAIDTRVEQGDRHTAAVVGASVTWGGSPDQRRRITERLRIE